MPQFAIRVHPSTDPHVLSRPPEYASLTLAGCLGGMTVSAKGTDRALITGYFKLRETLPNHTDIDDEVAVLANGQDIEIDFYWPNDDFVRRPLAEMFIDFYDPQQIPGPLPIRSNLRLSSYIAGRDPSAPANNAVLVERVEVVLRTPYQQLMIDKPSDSNRSGHFIWQLAMANFVNTVNAGDTGYTTREKASNAK